MKDDIAFAAVIFASLVTLFAVLALNSWEWTNTAIAAAFGTQSAMARAVSCAQEHAGQLVNRGAASGTADGQALAHSSDRHQ